MVKCVGSNVTAKNESQHTSLIPKATDLYVQSRHFYIHMMSQGTPKKEEADCKSTEIMDILRIASLLPGVACT